MDSRLKVELEDLRLDGEKLASLDVAEAERACDIWAERLFVSLCLLDTNTAQTIKSNSALGVHQRIQEDLATLKTVLEAQ